MRSHHNGLKTFFLFSVFIAVLLLIGGGLTAYTGNTTYVWIFGVMALGSTFYSYWNSDKIALRSMRAQPVTEQQEPVMYRVVRELSQRANQPMPRLYVSPTDSPNAFATGRNPQHAAVCCTAGILRLLDERELRGVLGHELMHVYNRDILTASVAQALASLIGMVAQIVTFGGMNGRRDRGNANILVVLATALLAPLAASILQFAISRTREYDADEDGSKLTGDPLALASALDKLDDGIAVSPLPPTPQLENAAQVMIANPFAGAQKLFSTHPPIEDRIGRLREQARRMGIER